MEKSVTIVVRCPLCKWRLMDKVTPTSGTISIKCPRCHQVVEVNLALRRKVMCRCAG